MSSNNSFAHFGLDKNILSALSDLGYERATPIQEQGIPILLKGEDLLAQAQTGTGKTATFALPILSQLDHTLKAPQALILAPTRELAIQVAEALQSYAKHLRGFLVTPIYGGQDFGTQLRSLKRGSQVIVGTPGRLMDHMRRKTLPLDALKMVVLDEADEMLKMGFAEDVEWILGQLTKPHQTALFSATLPASIQKIAQKYLKNAKKIQIKSSTNTVEAIEQSYISVSNRNQKLDVLTRILEVEDNQGVIIFTRTKTESTE
ncbi:MAG: DEAD/DEAH box helicase, partial [Gammaproteobacteria bacterium CG_4_9_14_3_um_filter_38_9]